MNCYEALPASSDQYESRNFHLGILQRALGEMGKTLADPGLVLVLLVRQLGGSNTLVGLLSTIRFGTFFLPQLLVAGRIEDKPRKAPYYVKAQVARCVGYAFIAIAILTLPRPDLLLPIFFALFAASYLAHGAGSVPNFDVLGRAIPTRQWGRFFAQRNFWGGVVGFVAGLVVRQILNTDSGPPPLERYAWLILLSAAFYALAAAAFWAIVEPVAPTERPQVSWWRHLRRAPSLLTHNLAYRQLTGALVLMTLGQRLADSFYIVYATEVLGVPVAMAGVYLSALTFAKIVSNVFWDRLSRRRESKMILQLSATAALAVPITALLIGLLPAGALSGYAFLLVFLLRGVCNSGKHISKRSVLLDIVPVAERPTYWGLLNTILGVVSLLPVVAGKIVDWLGFQPLFGLVAFLALLSWLNSRSL